MYSTPAPPALAATRPPLAELPLGLARIVHRRFANGGHRLDDDFSTRHFTDLTSGYGVRFQPETARTASATNLTMMAQRLMAELAADTTDPAEPIELAVVAHAIPDVDCRYAAATYLSEFLPGGPLVFAVSEDGSATPITALRLAGDYATRHGYRRALVFAFDQCTLPYDVAPEVAPAGDAGVAMLLSADAAGSVLTGYRAGVTPAELPDVVTALLSETARPGDDILLGPELACPAGPWRVRRAAIGYPCTAVWEPLAGPIGRTVLLNYDATTAGLSVCVVDGSREAP